MRAVRTKLLIGSLLAVLAVAIALFGGLLASTGSESQAAVRPAPSGAAELLAGFSTGDTARFVRKLELRVQESPGDADSLTLLGLAYQQRARETADPVFYS